MDTHNYTDIGMVVNHTGNRRLDTIPGMKRDEPQTYPGHKRPKAQEIVWNNLCALMRHEAAKGDRDALNKDDEPNLNWLAREAKIGMATANRLKKQETAPSLATLEKLAARFNLKRGDLLLEDLDPANPPVAHITEKQRAEYEQLQKLKRAIDEAEGRSKL